MTDEKDIQTVTMAGIYADQGHYEKAADIYKFLLEKDPDRQDLADALARIRQKQIQEKHGNGKDLAQLLDEWFTLLLRYHQLQQLKEMKNHLNGYGGREK